MRGVNLKNCCLLKTKFYEKNKGSVKNLTQEQINLAWTIEDYLPQGLDKLNPPLKFPPDRIAKQIEGKISSFFSKEELETYLKECEKQPSFRKVGGGKLGYPG